MKSREEVATELAEAKVRQQLCDDLAAAERDVAWFQACRDQIVATLQAAMARRNTARQACITAGIKP